MNHMLMDGQTITVTGNLSRRIFIETEEKKNLKVSIILYRNV